MSVRLVRRGREDGSAVVEFMFLGVLLLIPLVYLIITVAQLQAASYAVTLAAREAGRAFVTTPTGGSPQGRANAAAKLAFDDQGLHGGTIAVKCAADPCLTPDAAVTVDAHASVALPLPTFLADTLPTVVTVSSTAVVNVDRFKGA